MVLYIMEQTATLNSIIESGNKRPLEREFLDDSSVSNLSWNRKGQAFEQATLNI